MFCFILLQYLFYFILLHMKPHLKGVQSQYYHVFAVCIVDKLTNYLALLNLAILAG